MFLTRKQARRVHAVQNEAQVQQLGFPSGSRKAGYKKDKNKKETNHMPHHEKFDGLLAGTMKDSQSPDDFSQMTEIIEQVCARNRLLLMSSMFDSSFALEQKRACTHTRARTHTIRASHPNLGTTPHPKLISLISG